MSATVEFSSVNIYKTDIEEFLLKGKYAIESNYINKAMCGKNVNFEDFEEAVNCKSVYFAGNILYKKDEINVWQLIDLMIEATHKKVLSETVDRTVASRRQILGGTICPTMDTLFRFNGKLFYLIGRYIYGYDNRYVRFENKKQTEVSLDEEEIESSEEYEDIENQLDEEWHPSKLTVDEILLPMIRYGDPLEKILWLNDYNYSFKIVDEKSGVLTAFGLYR